jgi:transposase
MFPIVAEQYKFVVGVDTHARKHVAVIINNLGVVVSRREFRVLPKDFTSFIDWALRVTGGALANTDDSSNILFAVEGTSSYGETLTQALLNRKLNVTEVKPPKTKSRGASGKTDHIDAELAAIGVLRLPVNKLVIPRMGSTRKLLRVLLSSRRMLVAQASMNKNALTALLRSADLKVDARKPLLDTCYEMIARWKVTGSSELDDIRAEAKRLAKGILAITKELEANKQKLYELVERLAPKLLDEPGVGPVTLAQIICSYSHKGRIRSAEAFASLAGTTPIPASSGNTVHYRL